jgi:hypothetical protein
MITDNLLDVILERNQDQRQQETEMPEHQQ